MTVVRTGIVGCVLAAVVATTEVSGYPLDAYDHTGIARLEFYRLAQLGEIRGRQLPPGARHDAAQIRLNEPKLPRDADGHVMLPPRDRSLSARVTDLLAVEDRERYGVAVLDFTDAGAPVYAAHNDAFRSNVGSVGKVLVGLAVLNELARLYPHDIAQRERVLRDTVVVADEYALSDHHQVPLFDVANRDLDYRALEVGDAGSLWEYLDWMFSASSNSAASMVLQQATLLRQFGHNYPLATEAHAAWLEETSHRDEGGLTVAVLTDALRDNGFDTATIRQGSYFTRGGKRAAAGTTSYATPRALVRLLGMLETGSLVDPWTSLELKKLMYMTQRRIRYASHPALNDSAVYFKSGSLYSCKPEPGFTCKKYRGNRRNILASVAIVESPAEPARGAPPLRYAVAVISNVLYDNAAVAHQTLAMRIHRLLQAHHAGRAPAAADAGGSASR